MNRVSIRRIKVIKIPIKRCNECDFFKRIMSDSDYSITFYCNKSQRPIIESNPSIVGDFPSWCRLGYYDE